MKSLTPKEAYEVLQNGKAILIDVREQEEYDEWHIDGALLAPLSILPQAIEAIDFPQDKKIIFQCLKGGRSAQAIEFLSENKLLGHDTYNLDGGILQWHHDDLPIITP